MRSSIRDDLYDYATYALTSGVMSNEDKKDVYWYTQLQVKGVVTERASRTCMGAICQQDELLLEYFHLHRLDIEDGVRPWSRMSQLKDQGLVDKSFSVYSSAIELDRRWRALVVKDRIVSCRHFSTAKEATDFLADELSPISGEGHLWHGWSIRDCLVEVDLLDNDNMLLDIIFLSRETLWDSPRGNGWPPSRRQHTSTSHAVD